MEIIKKYLKKYNEKIREEIRKDSFNSTKYFIIEYDNNKTLRFYNKYDGCCYCIATFNNKMEILKRLKKEMEKIK